MTQHFNYGPRMNLDNLHQHRVHSAIIPSEYLEGLNSKNTRPSDSLVSSNSSLGSHWKKIESLVKLHGNSISSAAPSGPSKPVTIPSSFSSYSSSATVVPSLHSLESSRKSSASHSQFSTSSASNSSATVNGNLSASLSQVDRFLGENTETREERQCLSLQMQGLEGLNTTLVRAVKQFSDSYRKLQSGYDDALKKEQNTWTMYYKLIDCLDETIDSTVEELEVKAAKLYDMETEILSKFHKKAFIEKFVRDYESVYETNTKTIELISENEQRVANIRKFLTNSKRESATLTVFEQEDYRMEEVFHSLVKMVRTLPLNENERADIEHAIEKINKDQKFEKKYKCEQIIHHLMTIMNNWEDNKSTNSWNSDDWKSVPSMDSRSNGQIQNIIESSSFALTDPTTNDSNLNDLEGELRSASIRVAVEGPKGIYECSPWETASNFSGWSNDTDGHTSIQSLREPMTLSSYELNSSGGQSTLSSLSTNSMPNQIFENKDLILGSSDVSQKTAYSASEPVIARPPRSTAEHSTLQHATGTRTMSDSAASLNFSSVSLSDMVDDALHTAKDVAETQTSNLLDALQNSARKCGVALSDLMTAVSSSSESLSDTQASHHSNYSVTH